MVAQPRLPFERFFSQCEKHRWKLDQDVTWSDLRRDLVSGEELQTLRLAALTEGFSPTYVADLLDLYCDDPEMGAFLSIQFYEEYKHFHALRRYLRLNGREITDAELTARRSQRTAYSSKLIPLLKFGLSEIFTAIFYRNLSRSTHEPVLQQLCQFIAADEYRHLNFYMSYLEYYIEQEHVTADELLGALRQYQHQGLEAVEGWTDFWQHNGRQYTGLEPYVVMQNTLSRIAGTPISLRGLAQRTSDRTLATTFH
jgi:Fatty acid desaturase.